MSLQKTICAALIGLFMATAVYADVIPFFGKRHYPPRTSHIMMHIDAIPKGMEIILLDRQGALVSIANADEKVIFIIEHADTVIYYAWENQLSKPFSLQNDRTKLVSLKTITTEDIPVSFDGNKPEPVSLGCSLTETNRVYSLTCSKYAQ